MMKRLMVFLCFLAVGSTMCFAQAGSFSGTEPEKEELGAPLFPGAVFLRTVSGLDPYYETALYVTLDEMRRVEIFYEQAIPEKQKMYVDDENLYMTVFLLKTWSTFSGKPTSKELAKLEKEPNIQILDYDPDEYEPLAELYEKNPEKRLTTDTIRAGRSLIRYTYKRIDKNKNAQKIIGTWTSVDRDLPVFFGSSISFKSNGTYIFTLNEENVAALTDKLSTELRYAGKSKEAIQNDIKSRNPEQGSYVIQRNTITFVSESPLIGQKTKSGLAKVGNTLLSLEIINQPRLSLIKDSSKDTK